MRSAVRVWPSILVGVFLSVVACKTSQPDSSFSSSFESASSPYSELQGFAADGTAVACPPLVAGASCLPEVIQRSSLPIACAEVEGQLLYCEDCALLCSKPIAQAVSS